MKTISDKQLLKELLFKNKLDHFFPSEDYDKLQLIQYQKGESLCLQGQEIKVIGYTLSGSVKIVRRLFNGKEHILKTHSAPCLIGDIELMTNQRAVTSVMALEKTYFVQLPLLDKEKLLKNPQFLYQIGRELALNFYHHNINASNNLSYSVKERLASHILANEKEGYFSLELTLLADTFGTSYRHLHRVLSQLIEKRIIKRSAFKSYQILNYKSLQALALEE
ncbi:cyclic nucleotide-binding domain-containing protein [Streptococcus didelphis]|uniref:Cyclic nucleotide-binding domain-containing protein n=1 Tax=Streptococcus didelphis TaxID=102886 RepID=A0ABY9LGM8_9STRE|nr:cyclic nucleotide-binding domain-containing protein [Streptococcus didelphis]WMB27913.1 cyclic nucleotide-binding domain-containing protein [Streptococcus didelphis]WMB29616.1 cyclic nucleotide-binding domain-containing protein [Streptococcus didelphis]